MHDSPEDAPRGKPAFWRTFVPSLLILVGTFFFISSACFSDGDSGGDAYYGYPYPSCPAASRTDAPDGGSATIVSPVDGEVFGAPDVSGELYVLVDLDATGVEITPATECRHDTGHFSLTLVRTDGVGCLPSAVTQPIELGQGETQYVYRLPPGHYELTASIVTKSGLPYVPELADSVAFTVDGEPLVIDGGVFCP